jgi:C-terminal processing protease CtpA/Prc
LGDGYNDPHLLNNPGIQPGGVPKAQNSYDRSGYVNPSLVQPAGAFFKNASYTHQPRQPGGFAPHHESITTQWTDLHSVGVTVKNTGSQHTDGHGVAVIQTLKNMPAAAAGLQSGDIIRTVNRQPVQTVMEFQHVLQQFPGPLLMTVNRDGRRNVTLTVHRHR